MSASWNATIPPGHASALEEDGIRVETHHQSRHACAHAEQLDEAARPASEIQAAPPVRHPDAVEHDPGVELKRLRLDAQALALALTPFDRVTTSRLHASSSYQRRITGRA